MVTTPPAIRRRATEMLVLATLFWGISFPVMKAIELIYRELLPRQSSWFDASSTLVIRFGVAAVLTLLWSGRSARELTWLEAWQGLGLGFFSGLGMLLQVDGLAYTSASTSAFLTQAYCLFLPTFVALRARRLPSLLLLVCSALVMAGVAILARVDWRSFHLGRGELETLLSSVVFACQILWLERPVFSRNRVEHFTWVMFAIMALVSLPVALATTQSARDWAVIFTSPSLVALDGLLVLFCTLISFVLMNRWQPALPAAEAALIYAAEPVFASVFALFLPVWLSAMANITYRNETATLRLLAGGGLITLANVLLQLRPPVAQPQPHALHGAAVVPVKESSGSKV